MRLDDLIDAAVVSPTLGKIVQEIDVLLDQPFEKKLPATLSQLVSELSLESFIDEAIEIRDRKYLRKHFTLLSANTLMQELSETETASKLVSEYWNSGGETYEGILDELSYAFSS